MCPQECNDEYKIRIYGLKTPQELKDQTDKIVEDLSLFGRSFTGSSRKSGHALSRRFGVATKRDIVRFAWNQCDKKSVVVLKPGYQLERISKDHVKIKRR